MRYMTFDDLAEVNLSSTSSCFKGITNRHQPLLSINTLVLLSKTSTMPRGVPALGYRDSPTTMERRHPIELSDNAKFIARYRLDKDFVADFSQKFGASEYCPVKGLPCLYVREHVCTRRRAFEYNFCKFTFDLYVETLSLTHTYVQFPRSYEYTPLTSPGSAQRTASPAITCPRVHTYPTPTDRGDCLLCVSFIIYTSRIYLP